MSRWGGDGDRLEEQPPLSRDEQFRMFLASSDEACPGCGYSLRGLTGMRCPECNQELKLQVGLAEPRLAWFIVGLVGTGMNLGFCALLLAYAGYTLTQRGAYGIDARFWVPMFSGLLVGGVLVVLLIRMRRRMTASPAWQRWGLVGLLTAIGLVCPIWFMSNGP